MVVTHNCFDAESANIHKDCFIAHPGLNTSPCFDEVPVKVYINEHRKGPNNTFQQPYRDKSVKNI